MYLYMAEKDLFVICTVSVTNIKLQSEMMGPFDPMWQPQKDKIDVISVNLYLPTCQQADWFRIDLGNLAGDTDYTVAVQARRGHHLSTESSLNFTTPDVSDFYKGMMLNHVYCSHLSK